MMRIMVLVMLTVAMVGNDAEGEGVWWRVGGVGKLVHRFVLKRKPTGMVQACHRYPYEH